MKPYVVKEGDYLARIAHAHGVEPDTIWNDPKNAELAQQREPNMLHPGDIVYVPDPKRSSLPLHMGTHNVYIAKVPRTRLRLVFNDPDKPWANEPYQILGLGEPEEGVTDGEGAVEIQVPVHIREVRIHFPKKQVTYPVHVGDMDPIDETTGVRKRLKHLGYYNDPSGGGVGDAEVSEREALRAFQRDNGLEATGTIDEATKAKLLEKHGG